MDVFLFDLDGTLADSIGDIAECANLVRDSFGLAPLPEAMILGFIGKGSRWLVAHTLAAQTDETAETLDDAVVDEAVRRWVRLYEQHMMDRTRLFPLPVVLVLSSPLMSSCITLNLLRYFSNDGSLAIFSPENISRESQFFE